ncbi:MAG: helix-turn-helix transcriptional regulator, partial [Actinobacteria bacterium]|nr:helix-turn-helix transcriptional regulator [Actinomycetota bacterium]
VRSRPPGSWPASLDDAESTCEAEAVMWGVALCRAVRAECLLATGDLPAGRRCAEEAVALAGSTVLAGRARGRALLALARALRAEGDLVSSEDVGHQALKATWAIRARHDMTEILELLAALAAEAGTAEEATRLFAAAAAARDRLGYPRPAVEEAAVTADLGRTIATLDQETFADAWSDGAALSLDEAVAYASRGRGGRKRPITGWASLTPTELEVARLAAEGLSNAEIGAKLFISAGTAKVHLHHIYAKLNLANRAQLTAEVTRRDG